MKTRAASAALLVLALLPGCASARPPRPELMAPGPPERGRYLALNVSLCVFCHSEIDWKAEGFPPRAGGAGAGRAPFSETLPWLAAPNLTPDPDTGAGRWTDEQFERAIRQGVGADGRTLHPAMPSASFRSMSDEDAAAIVAYFRSLPPRRKALPSPRIPPEIRGRLRPLPPPGRVAGPDRESPVRSGEYLAAIATCGHCHTPVDDSGAPIPGMEFAGGTRLKGPWGDLHAPNLTPDASGIECLGEKGFVHAMKTGEMPGHTLNAIMPWGFYRGMTDEDLRAVFAYLASLKPVRHFIVNSVAPTPCRKCGRPHGLGEKNSD